MKKLTTLIALFFVGFALFAQDPLNPKDDSGETITVCEPFLAATYDRDAQSLTIRYEDCQQDRIFWGWCGTFCGFGEETGPESNFYQERELMVGNLNGSVHYAESFNAYDEIPEVITINQISLNTGIYFVRIKTYQEGEPKIFHVKFAVN